MTQPNLRQAAEAMNAGADALRRCILHDHSQSRWAQPAFEALVDAGRALAADQAGWRLGDEPTPAMWEAYYDLIPVSPGTESWAMAKYPSLTNILAALSRALRPDPGEEQTSGRLEQPGATSGQPFANSEGGGAAEETASTEYAQNALAMLERLAIDPELADWLEHFVVERMGDQITALRIKFEKLQWDHAVTLTRVIALEAQIARLAAATEQAP